jgi:uncharacterized membrane protein YfcA
MNVSFIAAGLVVGVIVGLSGVGGSSMLAPMLILFFGVKATIAVGTDLVYSVPMKALAALAHVRQGTVDRAIVTEMVLGGVPASLLGLGAFALVRAHAGEAALEHLVRPAIGVVILIAAASSLVLHLLARRGRDVPAPKRSSTASMVAIGAVVGFLVSMTSIGSGSITLPLLLLALPAFSLRTLIGSEIVFAALIVPISAAGHATFGNVDWALAANLAGGAIPGAYLGSRLCAVLGESAIRPAVIGVLAYAGVKLL